MPGFVFNVLIVLAAFCCEKIGQAKYGVCSSQNVMVRCGQRCVCGSRGNLVNCTRIRKEFLSMTTDERERYVLVVKTASTTARYKSQYDPLIAQHKSLFIGSGVQTRIHFLTWHRWYVLQYENLLRQIDCNITVPYWNFTAVSGNPWATSLNDLWYSGDSGFGGNGNPTNSCVQTGPFREGVWQFAPSESSQRCLKRRFAGHPPDINALTKLLNLPASRFNDFESSLRRFHNTVHCLIGGTMCTTDGANAPEFFLVQAVIDKIWSDWQMQSNENKMAFYPTITQTLPSTNDLLPSQIIDNEALPGGIRVEYSA